MKRQQLVSTLWMMGCRARGKRSRWLASEELGIGFQSGFQGGFQGGFQNGF